MGDACAGRDIHAWSVVARRFSRARRPPVQRGVRERTGPQGHVPHARPPGGDRAATTPHVHPRARTVSIRELGRRGTRHVRRDLPQPDELRASAAKVELHTAGRWADRLRPEPDAHDGPVARQRHRAVPTTAALRERQRLRDVWRNPTATMPTSVRGHGPGIPRHQRRGRRIEHSAIGTPALRRRSTEINRVPQPGTGAGTHVRHPDACTEHVRAEVGTGTAPGCGSASRDRPARHPVRQGRWRQ